jgi:hypothetical protein
MVPASALAPLRDAITEALARPGADDLGESFDAYVRRFGARPSTSNSTLSILRTEAASSIRLRRALSPPRRL